MKELENQKDNRVEIVAEQQQRKEIKLIGQQRKQRGLMLWEYNRQTLELRPAKFKPSSVMISASLKSHDVSRTYTVVVNEHCIYLQALNEKNALKKLLKLNAI